ncbi:cysteine-rich KTR domain-containing protein [Oscillibacter sp.]|uniref:cysteine-rich KTR domain-containing protein n=1 Tax=Oscillibacter sp. TaxID=1945593 RepID=UPI0033941B4C
MVKKEWWYHCPHCGWNVQRLTEDSVLENVPLYCKRCHKVSCPRIHAGREYGSNEASPPVLIAQRDQVGLDRTKTD